MRLGRLGKRKIDFLMERSAENSLNDNQKASYLGRAINRQKEDEDVSVKEMQELCFGGLFAAVDTTSSVLSWNLLHIAINSGIQERLYEELSSLAVSSEDGSKKLSPDMFEKSQMPYFSAVLRETQRLTPSAPLALKKPLLNDMEICGINLTKGSVVMLDSHSVGMDPDKVDDPHTYNPGVGYRRPLKEGKDRLLGCSITRTVEINLIKVLDGVLARASQ